MFAMKHGKNKNRYYSIANKNYTILEVAKLFGTKIKFLPPRRGKGMHQHYQI